MRQRLLEARRKESGFTLIELLIVIVILGVLAGVVVFAVGAFSDRGEEAACRADIKAVEVAVEAYRAQTGNYPNSIGDLVPAYLRQAPPLQTVTDGETPQASDQDPESGPKHYITYWLNGNTVPDGLPDLSAGAVTGDLVGGTVTHDCSD